jgi:hypothetical protein
MVNKFTIYGERCSGTNYLEGLITRNFNATVTWEFGRKHFFGFNDLSGADADDTLFVGIVRDPTEWLNSFYRHLHHLPPHLCPKPLPSSLKNNIVAQRNNHNHNAYRFLNGAFYSLPSDELGVIIPDVHLYTKHRYKNIFEMRHTKLRFLVEDMPKKVKHYLLIKYEDLMNHFDATMDRIKAAGNLEIKDGVPYPLNIHTYKAIKTAKTFDPKKIKPHAIPKHKVVKNKNLFPKYEQQLGYL